MKANAPEKIFIPTILVANVVRYKEEGSIEYTRTDAFIEKVLRYLDVNFYFNNSRYSIECRVFDSKEEMIEDFKKYIEGE